MACREQNQRPRVARQRGGGEKRPRSLGEADVVRRRALMTRPWMTIGLRGKVDGGERSLGSKAKGGEQGRGSRPGNIHIISFLLATLTNTYFDVFATIPPLLPPGPIAILGFGSGTVACILLHFYLDSQLHGWEIDPSVVEVGRQYFGLSDLQQRHQESLFINIGDALAMEPSSAGDGFAGILVDLYSKGNLQLELQNLATWEKMRRRLKGGGRVMVNCWESCVKVEDPVRDGEVAKRRLWRPWTACFK